MSGHEREPNHCEAVNVDGRGCSEFRGLRHCAYYEIWYCSRHHRLRREHGSYQDEHAAVCGLLKQKERASA